jgi:hypothetical protein
MRWNATAYLADTLNNHLIFCVVGGAINENTFADEMSRFTVLFYEFILKQI